MLLHLEEFIYNVLVPTATCQICTHEFYAKPSHLEKGWGKYCSKACQTKAQFSGEELECKNCGKKIYRAQAQIRHSKSNKFFCGKSCQTKWRNSFYIEEKHPNWQTGINAYRKIMKRSGIKQVCSVCNFADRRVLVVHHIDHNREHNNKSNLAWVCHNCHYLIHHDEEFEKNIQKKLVPVAQLV